MNVPSWTELVGGRILLRHPNCEAPIEVTVMEVSPMEKYLNVQFTITEVKTWICVSEIELLEILPTRSVLKDIANSWHNVIKLRDGNGIVTIRHTQDATSVCVQAGWTNFKERYFTSDTPLEVLERAVEEKDRLSASPS